MRNWTWIFLLSCFCLSGWHVQQVSSKGIRHVKRLLKQPYYSRHTNDSKWYMYQSSRKAEVASSSSFQQYYRSYNGTERRASGPKRNSTDLQRATVEYDIRQDLEDIRRANEHFLRIRQTATCQTPQPHVVNIKDYYPDPRKKHLPRCTILHRCTEKTGCCDEGVKCGPKAVQEVGLYFYTLQGTYVGLSNAVEKLLFINHTECECQPINKEPRAGDYVESHPASKSYQEESSEPLSHLVLANPLRYPPSQEDSKCRECPLPFYRREFPDGRCSCDCFHHHKPCLRIKRGRDPLSDIEKRCVRAQKCHIPDCEFGQYNYLTGKCPKRPRTHNKRNNRRDYNKQNHYQRWAFFERD
ncbi:uncharacterized protein LOC143237252 isoform X1 [Tachypleus tridentatus]|uniref:uncharacterized protein LOC143237252 isoform X1 n=2 Tax=Tachypleus tridentatus TaxID=6853 RepID=UPI003FD58A68